METLTATTRRERAQEMFARIPESFRTEFGMKLESHNFMGYEIHSLSVDKCNIALGEAETLSVSASEKSISIKNENGLYLNLYMLSSGETFYTIRAL